jgi:hypothetical protein
VRRDPEFASDDNRIDPDVLPPRGFVTATVNLAMMAAAERNGEFVADLATERAVLCEAKMVSVNRLASADQARLFRDEFEVPLVPEPSRLRQGEEAPVDSLGSEAIAWLLGARPGWRRRLVEFVGDNNEASIMSASPFPRFASFDWNPSSTRRASAVVKLFLAPRIRCAQVVAASGVVRDSNSDRS